MELLKKAGEVINGAFTKAGEVIREGIEGNPDVGQKVSLGFVAVFGLLSLYTLHTSEFAIMAFNLAIVMVALDSLIYARKMIEESKSLSDSNEDDLEGDEAEKDKKKTKKKRK